MSTLVHTPSFHNWYRCIHSSFSSVSVQNTRGDANKWTAKHKTRPRRYVERKFHISTDWKFRRYIYRKLDISIEQKFDIFVHLKFDIRKVQYIEKIELVDMICNTNTNVYIIPLRVGTSTGPLTVKRGQNRNKQRTEKLRSFNIPLFLIADHLKGTLFLNRDRTLSLLRDRILSIKMDRILSLKGDRIYPYPLISLKRDIGHCPF